MKVTDHVRGTSNFVHFRAGALLYRTDDTGFEFPVPAEDTNGATFEAQHKSLTLMRWIRKQIDVIAKAAEAPVVHPPVMETVRENVALERQNDQSTAASNVAALNKVTEKLTQRLIDRNPDLFHPANVIAFKDRNNHTVLTRRLGAKWTFEAITDSLYPADQERIENDILDALVGEITSELRREFATFPGDTVVLWYVPLESSGIVCDPETFEPIMTFKTRYAVDKR